MTDLDKNDSVLPRVFMGIPVEGDRANRKSYRSYTPRPIEELYPYFQAAFDKGIKAVTWHQYTPHFNDGEPCEFSVYDLSVTSSEEVAKNWLDGEFYEDRLVEVTKAEYDDEYWAAKNSRYSYFPYEIVDEKYYRRYEEGAYDYIPGSNHPDKIESCPIPVSNIEFEDALNWEFGDGTQVVVTPSLVVQFEYEHD